MRTSTSHLRRARNHTLKQGIGARAAIYLATLLMIVLAPGVVWAMGTPGADQPRPPAAQEEYPAPATPSFPTYDPYAPPAEPGAPTATRTPTLAPGTTPTADLYPTLTPTQATPGATGTIPSPTTLRPSPTLRVRTITPLPDAEQPIGPIEEKTPSLPPTPDRAAILIATAVAQEEATLAAPADVPPEASSSEYGWFIAIVALLLAGIGYAALLQRQRARDRQASLQEPPEE